MKTLTLEEYARLVEGVLEDIFRPADGPFAGGMYEIPPVQLDSMRYSVMAGGKRLRPAMLLATVDMLDGDREAALIPAAAMEMIHSYSLIHDDLPGMDDDTLRRGRPTNHVVYGVGQAILAGDGLLNRAYEMLLWNAKALMEDKSRAFDPARYISAMSEIALNAGAQGMVGGQAADLACEKGTMEPDEKNLVYIQLSKTACLFAGAMRFGARLAGASEDELLAVTRYAKSYGRLFQIVDDMLDEAGDPAALGKSVGKDRAQGKLTAVSVWGMEGARERADDCLHEGLEALAGLGEGAAFFEKLIRDAAKRKF